MYLVWINPPINFTFSDDSVFLKKILAGDINSLNLLVCIYANKNAQISMRTSAFQLLSCFSIKIGRLIIFWSEHQIPNTVIFLHSASKYMSGFSI